MSTTPRLTGYGTMQEGPNAESSPAALCIPLQGSYLPPQEAPYVIRRNIGRSSSGRVHQRTQPWQVLGARLPLISQGVHWFWHAGALLRHCLPAPTLPDLCCLTSDRMLGSKGFGLKGLF